MLSVVIPARDEAENLGPLIAETHLALAEIEHEILIVDDGSTDGTAEVLRKLRRTDPRLRVLVHELSCGQSAALRTGVRAARHPWIATLDGDGQNDPADLPELWRARPPDHDPAQPWLAIGHRTQRRDTPWRRFVSRFANGVRARMLRDGTPDTGCGTKLFGRAAYLELPWFDHQHRYLPALMRRAGGESVSLPVRHRPRERGQSKYGTWGRAVAGISDLRGVRWLIKRNRLPQARELE